MFRDNVTLKTPATDVKGQGSKAMSAREVESYITIHFMHC